MKASSLALAAAMALPCIANAAETDICPAAIQTQQDAKQVPYPFRAVEIKRESPLMGLTFFDGDPKELASLAPDEEKHAGGLIVSTWTFPPGNPRGITTQCLYEGTRIVLERALDSAITSCQVTSDPKLDVGGLPFIRRIDCK